MQQRPQRDGKERALPCDGVCTHRDFARLTCGSMLCEVGPEVTTDAAQSGAAIRGSMRGGASVVPGRPIATRLPNPWPSAAVSNRRASSASPTVTVAAGAGTACGREGRPDTAAVIAATATSTVRGDP